MTIKRLPHWETLLAAHFAAAGATPFSWGTFDCALATCDGVKAITGVDPGASVRGKYSTEAAALAVCGPDLGNFVAGICTSLGFSEFMNLASNPAKPAPAFGRRGDVALVDNGDPAHALGTIDLTGRFAYCASAKRGFVRVPMKRWLRAWKIG